MKRLNTSPLVLLAFSLLAASALVAQPFALKKGTDKSGRSYEWVEGDPLKTRIYTLSNGLKVYLSVYKNTPRIQTYVAVKAGSKMDPSTLTGLAHYLEHMVFKGTSKIGAANFAKESPLLAKIESTYEEYRQTKDESKRKKIYKIIDSLSLEASQHAIANEYDKMLSTIGATGTNAYTWVEQTVYVNDIPSNEIERWAKIEAERFGELVPRLFHTELEAVYEEKNRSLDNDMSKVIEATFALLFPNHPYGSQTAIGTVEHLKNPSIKAIKEYFYTYYVPNNMAICLSGDLDPENTMAILEKYWGTKKSKPVPEFVPFQEKPLDKVSTKTVVGPSPQSVVLCYRFPGASSSDAMLMEMFSKILSNGKAGLMDLNLIQKQKLLQVYALPYRMKDYSINLLYAIPRQGQSLEEAKSLMLGEIEQIKKGNFDANLLEAIINNEKIALLKSLEDNKSRADYMVDAFIKGISWQEYVAQLQALSTIKKEQIIDFANKYYGENYVQIYKLNGKDTTIQKVPKPVISPVNVNRESNSEFFKNVMKEKATPIQPVFVDYTKDMTKATVSGNTELWYKKNEENALFELHYNFKTGKATDPYLALAFEYLNYLGTESMKSEQIKSALYSLGCDYHVNVGENESKLVITGLAENMTQAVSLVEGLVRAPKAEAGVLESLIEDILKSRADAKLNKGIILRSAMVSFAKYGKKSPFTNIIPEDKLRKCSPDTLLSLLRHVMDYEHTIWYFGPEDLKPILSKIQSLHKIAKKPIPLNNKVTYPEIEISKNKVYFVHYDMVQAEAVFLSKVASFHPTILGIAQLYNEYFGGGMGSVVFQEIRESKALAYASSSAVQMPVDKDYSCYSISYIGTQADKIPEALPAMQQILGVMPLSAELFASVKEGLINTLRTSRTIRTSVFLSRDLNAKRGLTQDPSPEIFNFIINSSLQQVKDFHLKYIANAPYTLLVIGNRDKVDRKALEKIGEVQELDLNTIFGY